MRLIALVSALLLPFGAALAQDYPVRPVTMLVPFAAGGPTDTIARLTAAGMTKSLGQQVIVENAPGAGGTIATTRASRAQPDGYTLLIHHVGLSTAATLYRNLSYDTKTAFAPIGLVTNAPMTIIARPDFPADTLKELVAYAQQQGDKLTYANAGLGAASHLCGMLFMTAIQKQLTAVPYKGNGPIMNDLLGKQMNGSNAAAADRLGLFRHLIVDVAAREHWLLLLGPGAGLETTGDSLLAVPENLGVFSAHSKCPLSLM